MTTDTMSAAMWLHLLRSRKPMNAAVLSDIAGCSRGKADSTLSILATRGYIRGHRDPARKNGRSYTVDAACLIPRRLALQQVLEAAGAQGMPEAPEMDIEVKDRPLPPRGAFGIGRVSSVFALGARA